MRKGGREGVRSCGETERDFVRAREIDAPFDSLDHRRGGLRALGVGGLPSANSKDPPLPFCNS